MNLDIEIILVQSRSTHNDRQFRIAKLIGAVSVETSNSRKCHVGDVLKEDEANDLAANRLKQYKVTVTEKAGAR